MTVGPSDNWILNSDTCNECGEHFWHGEPCGCPPEEDEEEEEE